MAKNMATKILEAHPVESSLIAGNVISIRIDHTLLQDATGTVVFHHDRVKRPGKQVPNFSTVELKPFVDDVDSRLAAIARSAGDKY